MNTPEPCVKCKKMFYNVLYEDVESSAWCNAGWNEFCGDPNCPHFEEGEIDLDLSFKELRENNNKLLLEVE